MTDIERRIHQMLAAEEATARHLLATEVTRDPKLVEAEMASRTLRRVLAVVRQAGASAGRAAGDTAGEGGGHHVARA